MSLILPWLLAAGLLVWLGIVHARLKRARSEQGEAIAELSRTNVTLTRISQAVESSSDAIGIGSIDGHSLYHNRAHVELFGYTVPQLNALPETGVLFADPAVAAQIHESVRGGHSWVGETEVLSKSGRKITALVRTDLILDEERRPVGIFGVFTDMTERRRNAAILDAERQRLSITLQSIADGVIATDAEGHTELMNRVAEQLTGWRESDARGQPLANVLALLDEARRLPINPLTEMSSLAINPQFSAILLTRDGAERTVTGKFTLLTGAAGMVFVFRDVTTERQLTEERDRANRLESLGLLAGGIAHDFSNLLTAIMGNISLAQLVEQMPASGAESLEQAMRASLRARDLTMQLLNFAKGGMPVKKPIALANLIRESVFLALQSAPEVEVDYEIPTDLWLVSADATQIGQVINNLAINAVQAMGQRGKLRISAQNLIPGGSQGTTLSSFPIVSISVSDTGPGIAPENLAKIFDPFFTTKTSGTGLGLATVYSIIQKHGGRTKVESTLGQGTKFQILLPAKFESGSPPSGSTTG